MTDTSKQRELPTLNTLVFTAANDVAFCARLVFQGDTYGLDQCRTHAKAEPILEFYDVGFREEGSPYGQFVSRYYVQTLYERDPRTGLCLEGGVLAWTLDAESVDKVLAWAKTLVDPKPKDSDYGLIADFGRPQQINNL